MVYSLRSREFIYIKVNLTLYFCMTWKIKHSFVLLCKARCRCPSLSHQQYITVVFFLFILYTIQYTLERLRRRWQHQCYNLAITIICTSYRIMEFSLMCLGVCVCVWVFRARHGEIQSNKKKNIYQGHEKTASTQIRYYYSAEKRLVRNNVF